MSLLEDWLEDCALFRRDVLGQRMQFLEATSRRADSVRALTPSWAIDDLLREVGDNDVIAWFQTVDGCHRTTNVRPSAARELYRGGTTLYIRKPRFLEPLATDVAAALRIPRTFVECTLFCNQPRARSLMHFDPVDTITLQITGSKRWTTARNSHAPSPMTAWGTPNPVKPPMRLYAHDPFPMSMPSDACSYLLEAGAMLYVPRGYWHETWSEEESVSLHIHLLAYPWLEAMIKTLEARLVQEEAWRSTAYGLWDPELKDALSPEKALEGLREIVNKLTPDDLVRTTPTLASRDRIIRRPRSSFGLENTAEGGAPAHVTFTADEHGFEHVTNVEMSAEYVAATQLVESTRDGISAEGLSAQIPSLKPEEALQLACLLVEVGYARRV